MEIFSRDEARLNRELIFDEIRKGSLFIYPTDTIYGIGCNALIDTAVQKLRKLKNNFTRPLSVIAPSKEWVKRNCELNKVSCEWLDKLPGPYTLILSLKSKSPVAGSTNLKTGRLGIRMPKHWFHNIIKDLDLPIITTSANITGNDFMTSLSDLDSRIKRGCSFMIDEGTIKGRPSTIVDLASEVLSINDR
ncbi:Sua5/YciO/YrdC/YwlC family protein [Candidatus Woesearchaeota archaeon]|nr:Sua5/YciO/YrdC/YwlC family protein [Candidatus Woesearchaeota archaeon]